MAVMPGAPVLLALLTLASEDLACVAAGVLVARGELSPAVAVLACAMGIFAGDCGLWALGRFGGGVGQAWPWMARRLTVARKAATSGWLERHAGVVLFVSRFTPGTRLPLYVGAGLVGMSFARFAVWTSVAVSIWTPAVVLASARAGEAGAQASTGAFPGWTIVAALMSVLVMSRGARALVQVSRSTRFRGTIARWRWEFWPAWLFYAPVVAWVALLALRHRGLSVITTCNPGIPDGGIVGESKADILERLPAEYTIPFRRLVLSAEANPLNASLALMSRAGWSFPVIVKPDMGQRGAGVKLIRSVEQLASYLSASSGAVLLQPFHEGPHEAGIFYYRFPHEPRGRIFSITDKQFPVVVGDGVSTLRQLVEAHPRYRLQASIFLARHAMAADVVLAGGERKQLAVAGNHAQGTTFRDGGHLWTAALEARIDAIARHYDGFCIGRFDVRYRDVDAFKAGRDLAIVELNGATAESTNIYDRRCPLLGAYRVLFRQWALVFAIGDANRARGAAPSSLRRLASLIARHLTARQPFPIAD
jgi:membrane protein DedA with SNARE-associated domain